uniref:sensor histidine kinase n=1 Tax=Cupriavidus necator TaxID=106590 RepID=UPI003F490F9D
MLQNKNAGAAPGGRDGLVPGRGPAYQANRPVRGRRRREQQQAILDASHAARECERQRIACSLHDEVGQALALALLRLGRLEKLACPPQARALIGEARTLVAEAAASVRAATIDLGLGLLAQGPLDDALRSLAHRAEDGSSGVPRLLLDLRGPQVPLEQAATAVLLRVVKELLANVRKHSGASQVWVRTACKRGHVTVSVEDDGRGFDPGSVAGQGSAGGGFGLPSSAAQLRALGARLEVGSAHGSGTHVRIVMPTGHWRAAGVDTGGSAHCDGIHTMPRG